MTIGLLAVAAGLALFLVYWIVLLTELPSTDDLQRSRFERATIVYAADGTELTSYQDKNRKWVSLDEISPHVVNALLATEDHRFYEHRGIDIVRTIGSAFKTLGGDAQGGSTITMQFARNAFPDIYDDMVFTRKIKEWITALRIEAMYEKDDILEMYLNTVPFMYNAFGIEAAAQTYFQLPASDLNARGAATLVGMLKGTVYYNPVRNPERSHERRNVVLQQMVKYGYLDQADYEAMRDNPTRLSFNRLTRADEMAPHFTGYLRQWLDGWAEQNGFNLYTDGLRVHTTIQPALQQAAQAAVERVGAQLQAVADVEWSRSSPSYFSPNASAYEGYRRNVAAFDYFWRTHGDLLDSFIKQTQRYGMLRERGVSAAAALDTLRGDGAFMDSLKTARQRLQAGLVAIDPRSGHVLAWVGGRDFGEVQYDHVAQSKRQPGSTFKPFVYAAALESGYSPTDHLRDEIVEFVDPDTRRRWRPRNVGAVTGELVPLRDALAYSKNTITAQLVQKLGPQRVIDTAHRMGIRSELPPYPSIGLGTGEVSLLELAGAYTSIADYGQYHEPVFVTRIEDQQGRLLAQFSSESRQALSAVTAYHLLDMMRGTVDYGTGQRIRYMFGANGDLAGKTGTTQNGADGWFMLLHPNLVMGAWVGFEVPAISFRSNYWGQGSHNALHVVGQFYRDARRAAGDVLSDVSFTPPPGYRPPRSIDTTLYASDMYYDSSYLDSLNAISDSLMQAYQDDEAYDDSTWRYDYGWEDDSEDTYEELETDSLDLEALEMDEEEEELSPADSLNRLERRTSPLDRRDVRRDQDRRDPLRRNRDRDREDQNGSAAEQEERRQLSPEESPAGRSPVPQTRPAPDTSRTRPDSSTTNRRRGW